VRFKKSWYRKQSVLLKLI